MELWKIHKFCETANLQELIEREKKLKELVERGAVKNTNAEVALGLIRQYIELKSVFGD